MGSYAHITVDGFPIESSKNYFYQWFFRKSERRIVSAKKSVRNPLVWGLPEADDADELESNYAFEAKAAILKRRLELSGATRSALEREFKEAIAQRIAYAEEHDHEQYGDFRAHIAVLRETTLDQWLSKLKEVIDKKLRPDHWDSSPLTGDVLIDMLLRQFAYTAYSDDGAKFELNFPCMTFDGFARAVLEVVADDAPCVLDVTDLVHGGWTDAFDDLIEYSQDFTSFYQVFTEAIDGIKALDAALPDNPILARLLYANTITAMETYLGDMVKKNVLNRPPLLRRFAESHPGFVERKVKLSEVFSFHDDMKELASKALDEMSFHNIERALAVYESVFAAHFPREKMPALFQAVRRRHDIVHRNGKDASGKLVIVGKADLDEVIELVRETVRSIDKQVKDGLIDDEADPREE